MTFATVRSVSIAAAVALSAFSAQALTIPTNSLQADSFQVFSKTALQSYALFGVKISPLGNATAVAGTTACLRAAQYPCGTRTCPALG